MHIQQYIICSHIQHYTNERLTACTYNSILYVHTYNTILMRDWLHAHTTVYYMFTHTNTILMRDWLHAHTTVCSHIQHYTNERLTACTYNSILYVHTYNTILMRDWLHAHTTVCSHIQHYTNERLTACTYNQYTTCYTYDSILMRNWLHTYTTCRLCSQLREDALLTWSFPLWLRQGSLHIRTKKTNYS